MGPAMSWWLPGTYLAIAKLKKKKGGGSVFQALIKTEKFGYYCIVLLCYSSLEKVWFSAKFYQKRMMVIKLVVSPDARL